MTVRLIQVGLGLWGRDWAANVLPRVPEVEVVAWADGDPRALRLAAEVAHRPPGRTPRSGRPSSGPTPTRCWPRSPSRPTPRSR